MKLGMFNVRGDSPVIRVARGLGLVLVTVAVVWGFWHTNEQALEKIKEKRDIHDGLGSLDESSMAEVKTFALWLREAYGLTLQLKITDQVLDIPKPDPRVLFVGLNPYSKTSAVVLPPLLERSLPADTAAKLSQGYFDPYFASGAPPEFLHKWILALLKDVRQGLEPSSAIPGNPQGSNYE